MNSSVIVLFLSGMVALIMQRTLHKDIAPYNQMESVVCCQKTFRWKLVHGDVFRPPKNGMLLSVMLGCGTQTLITVFFTLGECERVMWDWLCIFVWPKKNCMHSICITGAKSGFSCMRRLGVHPCIFFSLWMRFQFIAGYPGRLPVPTLSGERYGKRKMTCLRM